MWKDIVLGVLLLGVAGAYYAQATRLPISSLSDEVGPDGIPRVLGLLLAALAAIVLLRGVFGLLAARRAAAPAAPKAKAGERRGHLRAAGMFAIGLAYLLLVPLLGYPLAVALLIAAAALYLGVPRRPSVAVVAAGGAATFWVIFVKLLGVPLPVGLWGRLI